MKRFRYVAVFIVAMLAENAAAQTLRAEYNRYEGSSGAQALAFFKEAVATCSDGGIAVELVFAGSIGSPLQIVSNVSQGSVDIALVPSRSLEQLDSEIGVLSVPLVFNNRRHWETALGGGVISFLTEQIDAIADIEILDFFGGQQIGILSNYPIDKIEDIKDKVIRSSARSNALFETLGANVINLSIKDLYSEMASGSIDAAEITAEAAINTKMYQLASSFTRINHKILTELLIINSDILESLDDRGEACVLAAAEDAARFGREAVINEENAALEQLVERGVEILRLEDRQLMFQSASRVRDDAVSEFGGQEIFELIAASASCPNWCGSSTFGDAECGLCNFCE